jgi:hypothetical protein
MTAIYRDASGMASQVNAPDFLDASIPCRNSIWYLLVS